MAKLEDYLPRISPVTDTQKSRATNNNVSGKKRRAWLEQENNASKTIGSINPIDRPETIGSINPIDRPETIGSINPIDRPETIGSINPIDRPTSIFGSINQDSNKPNIISTLRGNPLKLLLFLYSKILNEDDCITSKIKRNEIVQVIEKNNNSVKTAIRFLKEKRVIDLHNHMSGKYGWSQFKIEKVYFTQISEAVRTGLIDPNTINISFGSIKSSSNKYNTTTEELPEQWIKITISPLEHIGFSLTQLKQLSKLDCCNPEIIQDSIYQFAYDLEYNKAQDRLKTTPLNALMGVLRKGQGWNAHNYKPPQDIALGKILERKKQEKASREKQLKELYNLEFDEWLSSKTDDELKDIYLKQAGSGANFFKYGGVSNAPTRAGLSKYFEENVWDNLKT